MTQSRPQSRSRRHPAAKPVEARHQTQHKLEIMERYWGAWCWILGWPHDAPGRHGRDRVAGTGAGVDEHPTGGFDPGHFADLAVVEEESFWFRARNQLILWAIDRYAPTDWTDLLEVGCGTGFVLQAIAERHPAAHLTGTELLPEGLAYARGRVPQATLVAMDALASPFRGAFDIVGAFDVIEHIEDDVGALRGMAEALRPGGILLVTVPQHPALWSASDVRARHVRRYSAHQLHRRIGAAGLEVVWSTSFVSLLLPALALSRLRPGGDSIRDQRVPYGLGAIFGRVMTLERAAIRAGLSLPIGGSRLVVATKPSGARGLR